MISDSASRHVFESMKRQVDPVKHYGFDPGCVLATPITVCSWCPGDPVERTRLAMIANGGRAVSHGICAECQRKMEE